MVSAKRAKRIWEKSESKTIKQLVKSKISDINRLFSYGNKEVTINTWRIAVAQRICEICKKKGFIVSMKEDNVDNYDITVRW